MVRVHVMLNDEVLRKIDEQRGTTARSKAIRKCLVWILDQNYLGNVIESSVSDTS